MFEFSFDDIAKFMYEWCRHLLQKYAELLRDS